MKRPKPFINQLIEDINWLYYQAPNFVVWFIVAIILAATLTTFGNEPTKEPIILKPIQEIYKSKCLCPENYTPIGVICSDNRLKLDLEPENGCICGNYSLTYWICQKNINPQNP